MSINGTIITDKVNEIRGTSSLGTIKPREDDTPPPVDLAMPLFGYQNRVSIDRGFGFVLRWTATDAAAYEGGRVKAGSTRAILRAGTAYRSGANEAFLAKNGFVSNIYRKKPKGRTLPEVMRPAHNAKSSIRSHVEHIYAEQKDRMDFVHPNRRDHTGDDEDRPHKPRL